ncbi:neprilysin-4-like [Hylaeus anthracinus]|uniref:neprilysin-4-like n=1 Tax=Hylaeus anthracinus TaxID=313031 RepID=UPI0023B9B8F6|nr:neprilysin-4-like [Hylaeus anthracinus]
MIRILILASLGAVINASVLSSHALEYPHGLDKLFGEKREAEKEKKERLVCENEECKKIGKMILESMDESVDPCDDFYEYACGKWAEKNPAPPKEDSWSLWQILMRRIYKQLQEIIETEQKPDDLFAVKLAKMWYKSCMNEEAEERRGLEPMLSTLWRHGGWPLIMEDGEWDDLAYTWQKVDDSYARLTGNNALHDLLYNQVTFGGNATIMITAPHLPPNLYTILSSGSDYPVSDVSDENNESGEGSLERGSKEKGYEKDENNEDDEDTEEDEDKEELRKRKVAERKTHKRLGHGRRRNKGEDVGGRQTRRRTHRSIAQIQERHDNHMQKRHAEHNVHHNAKKTKGSSKHGHLARHNKRNKPMEKHDHERKNKSKTTVMKTEVHDSKHHGENRINKHRHHVAQRRLDKEENDDNETDNENNDEDTEEGENPGEDEAVEEGDDNEEDEKQKLEEMREKYRDYIFNVSLLLSKARGIEIPREKLMKGVADLVEFAIKLGEIVVRPAYNTMTMDELQEIYDSFKSTTDSSKVNWKKKALKLFTEAGAEVDDIAEIVTTPKYFKKLPALLDETPTETIVNYVHWDFISKMAKYSTKEMKQLAQNWKGGPEQPREKVCMEQAELGEIVGYEYARLHFSEKVAKTARDMIDDIQKEVEYQIKSATWMDEDTEHFILDKLVNMKNLIGYPEWYKNTTLVKRRFQGLVIGSSYYENTLNNMRFKKWKSLRTVPDEDSIMTFDPAMLNAFFVPERNFIAVTAADFQSPFFALNRPWNVNYAIIGLIMAHEVNHGFDKDGHLYDMKGSPMEWLSAMAEAYNKRALCFIDQFNGYSLVQGENVTIEGYGNRSAGENIADTMGLQTVFRAYQRRERECDRPEPALPGLEKFSNEQTFFLSFANVWCESMNRESAVMQAKYDVHSPGRLRVIGSVSNSDEFAKAFNCPAGSPMNPETKCNIWI